MDNFGDAETQDVSFLIVGSTRTSNGDILADHNSIVNQLIQIAENRKRLYGNYLQEEHQLLMLFPNQLKVQMLLQTTRRDIKFLCSSRFRLGIPIRQIQRQAVGCLTTDIQQVSWQGQTY